MHKLTRSQIDEVCRKYRGGQSAYFLGHAYGVDPSAIYSLLKNRGIPRRSARESHPVEVAVRFWEKVRKGDSCWLWIGLRNDVSGYGTFWMNDLERSDGAHRVSWQLAYGRIPKGKQVCHRCDNRLCVKPDHLFLGSPLENMKDAVAKNRMARGTRASHPNKLNPQLIKAIRDLSAAGETTRAIGRRYGISPGLVSRIVNRKLWAHVV